MKTNLLAIAALLLTSTQAIKVESKVEAKAESKSKAESKTESKSEAKYGEYGNNFSQFSTEFNKQVEAGRNRAMQPMQQS